MRLGSPFTLVKLIYNNSYQTSIGMAHVEALYGRRYKSFLCWDENAEQKLIQSKIM